MRVAWILDGLELGGAERLGLRFAAGAANLDLKLIGLRAAREPLARVWGAEWAGAERRTRELGMQRLADPLGWLRLLAWLSRWRPVLVHTHLRYATIWGGAAAALLGIPHITTVHLGPGTEPNRRQRLAGSLERAMRRRAARVVYVSMAQRAAWAKTAGRERAVVIPNGVRAPVPVNAGERERRGIPALAWVMLTVAVVRPRKGWRIWLAAIERIAPLCPQAWFVWVGAGPELEELRAAAAASPWSKRIQIVGASADVGAWLGISDLFLFPSLEEALPTAVLEAMAAGVPVIASALPAVSEVLGAEGGVLVPPSDEAALAAAALAWSRREAAEERAALTSNARRRVDAVYGEAAWREQLTRLYREVLAERSAGRERPRLLMVEFFAGGGLLHYSWQLAAAMAAEAPGTEVVLLTGRRPECGGAPSGVRLLARLCTWNPQRRPRRLPHGLVRAGRGLRYAAAWLQVLRTVRRESPAVILFGDLEHRCDTWFVRHLARSTRRCGYRLADVWHNVEMFERHRSDRLLRRPKWRPKLTCEFDTVFVHGVRLALKLERLSGVRPVIIAHGNQNWIAEQAGADPGLDRRFGLETGRPLVLLFGTLTGYKGVEILLAALAAIPACKRPLALVAGMPTAGVRPDTWREQARKLGIEAWLRWDLRYVPTRETAWYFRRADMVVLPYLAASQSGVAHLALTFGKPLIVTSTGSLPEIIAGNGLVVPPGDVAALVQAIARLSTAPGLRQRMGRRSTELAATRHNWRTVARAVLAAFPELGAEAACKTNCQQGNATSIRTKAAPESPRHG